MLRSVAVVLEGSARAWEISALWELFGAEPFELTYACATPGVPIPLLGAGTITPSANLEKAIDADLLFVAPPASPNQAASPELVAALRARRGRVMSAGTGVFLLAQAGLLDGRPATTHWALAELLRQQFPAVRLRSNALYIDDDPVYTAAGAAATIDLCLHVVGKHLGAVAAGTLAQRIVLGPFRSGRSSQVVPRPTRSPRRGGGIGELLEWLTEHLHEELSLQRLAEHSNMSRRSFSRRFRAATGTTPYAWILEQRVRRARELLEDPYGPSVERVAARVGLGTAAALRHHLRRELGCTPTEYRARFTHR